MLTLETDQPLSESQLWQIVCNYYLHKGPAAWTAEETPNFVTSSCYIAHYYAQIIIHALQDWQQQHSSIAKTPPFYIVELSAGLGEFSFHCLKRLCYLQKLYQLEQIKFCYVITDIVPENVASWQQSHAFDDYLARGQVDFATYDLNKPEILQLIHSQVKLDRQQLDKPIIVIANYIFDTVACDVFYVNSGQLSRGMMTVTVPDDFLVTMPNDLASINTRVSYHPLSDPAIYPEPLYNQMIQQYRDTLRRGVVNFPIAALRYLQFLLDQTSGNMLLLIADKGYSTTEMIQQVNSLHISYHISLSVLVNFHALEQFFLHHQGDSFYQDRFTSLTTAVYSAGIKFCQMPFLQRFLQYYQHEVSPQEYCYILQQVSCLEKVDPLTMLAIFRLSKQDPIIFRMYQRQFLQLTNPRRIHFNQQLREVVQQMQENIYPARRTPELEYLVGGVYHVMGDYQQALEHFKSYKPIPEIEYEYYKKLNDCYVQLHDEEQVQQLRGLLWQAKYKKFFRQWYQRFKKIKIWARQGLRLLVVVGAALTLLYFILKHFGLLWHH